MMLILDDLSESKASKQDVRTVYFATGTVSSNVSEGRKGRG